MKHSFFCLMGLGLLSVSASASGWGSGDLDTRIVGGLPTTGREFPFIASLQDDSDHFCGGTLIRPDWVLTAAHCLVDQPVHRLTVVLGLSRLDRTETAERHRIIEVHTHPDYNPDASNDYDFALLKLERPSAYRPLALQTEDLAITESPQILVTVAGWGKTSETSSVSSTVLQKVSLPLVPNDRCNQAYGGQITDHMICAGYAAGGKDSCQGDSGGPLIYGLKGARPTLAGVVSWGRGCALAGYPGVYAKVSAVTDWVRKKTGR